MIITAKTNLNERYTPEERENIVDLLNVGEIMVTLINEAEDNSQPFGVDIERIVGTVVAGSAHIVESGQIEYNINIMEDVPLSKTLTSLVEDVPEWTPHCSLSMRGTFDDEHPKVEEIIVVTIKV